MMRISVKLFLTELQLDYTIIWNKTIVFYQKKEKYE